MLRYVNGDLFADKEAMFLAHACNCQNNWGKGIALELAKRFPKAYERHRLYKAMLGSFQLLEDSRNVLCLFTSKGYGRFVDPPDSILTNTEKALQALGRHFKTCGKVTIASPKINAGLFNVPWQKTENTLENFLTENPQFEWTVYSL